MTSDDELQSLPGRELRETTDAKSVSTLQKLFSDSDALIGPEYPVEAHFACEWCKDFATDDLSELREHVNETHTTTAIGELDRFVFIPEYEDAEDTDTDDDETTTDDESETADADDGAKTERIQRSIRRTTGQQEYPYGALNPFTAHPETEIDPSTDSLVTPALTPDEQYQTDRSRQRITEIVESSESPWDAYLTVVPLHRCPGCDTHHSNIGRVYCDSCPPTAADIQPCQNCGTELVTGDDPFCSPACASERLQAAPIYQPVEEIPDDWVDDAETRTPRGIPYATRYTEQSQFLCRECYNFGHNELDRFAMHIIRGHEITWADYIAKHRLNTCRACGRPLRSLFHRYCSDGCQKSDDDPESRCQDETCSIPTEYQRKTCRIDHYQQTDVLGWRHGLGPEIDVRTILNEA